MSGGSLDYIEYKLENCAESIRSRRGEDYLMVALAGHLDELKGILHDVEWDLSGDITLRPQDRDKIAAFIGKNKELEYAVRDALRIREELTRLIKKAGAQ